MINIAPIPEKIKNPKRPISLYKLQKIQPHRTINGKGIIGKLMKGGR